jgi:hypothetical protein
LAIKLSKSHKLYLLIEQLAVPAILNLLINGFIGWLTFRHSEAINIWTSASIGNDLLLTGALLPFIMSMINARLVAGKVHKGKIAPFPKDDINSDGWHNRSILLRSLLLSAFGLLFFTVPTIFIVMQIWAEPISLWDFVIFKGIWAAILAAIVSPVIAIWAITDASAHKYKAKT